MNIEDLTKTQLLLLTILVNFVTSIATGVMTVSLLDETPTTVIQTVNRIVDHTIETVTTEVPVIRNVPTAVPSTEELLTNALAKAGARTVHVFRSGSDEAVADGVFLSDQRIVLTVGNLPGTVRVVFPDGVSLEAQERGADGELHAYGFSADASVPSAPSGKLVALSELKQGQSAIVLGASGQAITGIVTRITDAVYTDLPALPNGAAAVNLAGDIIGVSAGDGRFVSADRMSALVQTP